MTIPESQLEIWSRQGAIATAKATHESVRRALTEASSLRGLDFEVYLQGSYKNDTNIRGDSDVDIVVQLNSTFQSDRSTLTDPQSILQQQSYPQVAYQWADFRRDVLGALRSYYGTSTVVEGDKAIKIAASSWRLPADVVVALQHRRYQWFVRPGVEHYAEGIVFYTRREQPPVINFPKQHYDNGVEKNGALATNGWYKPTVRLFKNARICLIDRRRIPDSLVPSYFLECLLYNVPHSMYGRTNQQRFLLVTGWPSHTDLSSFVCQNGQIPLFGPLPEQWSINSARVFLGELGTLWAQW